MVSVVDKTASHLTRRLRESVSECGWVQLGRERQPSAVTRLHMVICCTCGSGIGGLWWSELPPTHIHPIPFIHAECGSPFTLLSQRREGGRLGLGGGEERLGSQRERGGLSLLPGSERRKNNWCANGCLSLVPGWPAPPFLRPIYPSVPSAVSGCLEGGTPSWRGDRCKTGINNVADSLCCTCVFEIPLLCFVGACVCVCVCKLVCQRRKGPQCPL